MTNSKQILTSIHGQRLGLDEKNRLITQQDSKGISEIIAIPSDLIGLTLNPLSTLSLNSRTPAEKHFKIDLASTVVTMADNAGVVAYGSVKLFDLDTYLYDVLVRRVSVTASRTASGINADFDGDFSIGTDAANNTNALGANEANLFASTAVGPASAGVATISAYNSTTTYFTSTTAKSVYFNLLIDDADHDITTTPSNIVLTGYIDLTLRSWKNEF